MLVLVVPPTHTVGSIRTPCFLETHMAPVWAAAAGLVVPVLGVFRIGRGGRKNPLLDANSSEDEDLTSFKYALTSLGVQRVVVGRHRGCLFVFETICAQKVFKFNPAFCRVAV